MVSALVVNDGAPNNRAGGAIRVLTTAFRIVEGVAEALPAASRRKTSLTILSSAGGEMRGGMVACTRGWGGLHRVGSHHSPCAGESRVFAHQGEIGWTTSGYSVEPGQNIPARHGRVTRIYIFVEIAHELLHSSLGAGRGVKVDKVREKKRVSRRQILGRYPMNDR